MQQTQGQIGLYESLSQKPNKSPDSPGYCQRIPPQLDDKPILLEISHIDGIEHEEA